MLNVAKVIAQDVVSLVRQVMEGDTGINRKVGVNTLKDSELFKSVRASASEDIVIDLLLNDYIIYVESGRRKGAKMPPFDVIASWCKRKGLPSDNNTVWAICKAISRDGIAPRPVMAVAFSLMDADEWSGRWMDMVFGEVTKVLDNYFND